MACHGTTRYCLCSIRTRLLIVCQPPPIHQAWLANPHCSSLQGLFYEWGNPDYCVTRLRALVDVCILQLIPVHVRQPRHRFHHRQGSKQRPGMLERRACLVPACGCHGTRRVRSHAAQAWSGNVRVVKLLDYSKYRVRDEAIAARQSSRVINRKVCRSDLIS